MFQINCTLKNFLSIPKSLKNGIIVSIKKYETVFNMDNNTKCLLSSKSAY